jgi:uncharacterized protein (TIGR00369 family)
MFNSKESAPDGYELFERHSPVTDPWAPIYVRQEGCAVYVAIVVAAAHCNSRGSVHGGLLCALADLSMGLSAMEGARRAGLGDKAGVTTSLAIDFLERASPGELLEWKPNVLRAGRTLSVVECRIVVRDRLVARANATFKQTG